MCVVELIVAQDHVLQSYWFSINQTRRGYWVLTSSSFSFFVKSKKVKVIISLAVVPPYSKVHKKYDYLLDIVFFTIS